VSARNEFQWLSLFGGAVGAFLALALLKFGNPVVLEHKLPPPGNVWEVLLWSWPVAWAYPLLALLVVWGLWLILQSNFEPLNRSRRRQSALISFGGRWRGLTSAATRLIGNTVLAVIPWLPLGWFLWQCLSGIQTVHGPLTEATLKHFAVATACYYLGSFLISRMRDFTLMGLFLLAGVAGVIAVGLDQHFGGLEATRRFMYAQPDWKNLSPELLNKLASNRIYSTLFYPNTLAGALLLFLPVACAFTLTSPFHKWFKWIMLFWLGAGGLACLYWSGSKAGWLIALGIGLVAWLYSGTSKKLKSMVVMLLLVGGLSGFAVKYGAYFEKGAKSVGARLDYWKVATQIAVHHPVLGSGPGTFSVLYRYLKPPEAEMARLVHNDYLEQACDSGVVGFLAYGVFVVGSLVLLRPSCARGFDWLQLSVWLGVVGWATQSLFEFGLYVPALAWPAFLFLGWLWASRSQQNLGEDSQAPLAFLPVFGPNGIS